MRNSFYLRNDIPFMRYGMLTTAISLLTFIVSLFFLITRGLQLGIDFTGGTLLEVQYVRPVEVATIHAYLQQHIDDKATVQHFGTPRDILIRLPLAKHLDTAQQGQQILKRLQYKDPSATLKRAEFIGPQVGRELVEHGLVALALVCIGIALYLSVRFEWKFALAALLANIHDVVIILGFFSFFQWEFDLTVLAAVLAVLGYSVNESVVVFDRIRENFYKLRQRTVPQIIDNAITATMSRTILTHLSTQLTVTSMLLFGGDTLHNFSLALTIGILFGIYSSVLVASPLLLFFKVKQQDFIKNKKVGPDHSLP